MAKGRQTFKFVFIATLFLTALLVIGAGCNQNLTGEVSKTELPKMEMLFSDDFAGYSLGSIPSKWLPIFKEEPFFSVAAIQQKNSDLVANSIELGGLMLQVNDATSYQWKDYTIVSDFKIESLYHVGPIFIFRMQDENNYYSIEPELSATGGTYKIYKTIDNKKTEIFRKSYTYKLADKEWHKVEVKIEGNQISLKIDDKTVFSGIEDNTYNEGSVAFGTNPNSRIYFDNVAIIGTKF